MKPVRALMAAMLALLAGGCGKAPEAPQAQPSPKPGATLAGPELRIVALGDSLFAGYGLRPEQAYPVRLEAALRARGINAVVSNAGVSGDTTADGRQRLDFTLNSQSARPVLVLVCLGGNDMLRALPPAETRANLDAILATLRARRIKVVMMGMLAAPNLGKDYARAFNAVFPAVARAQRATLVPFFLRAVIDHPELHLPDHIHPTAPGVEAMVADTLGVVTEALAPDAKDDSVGH